MRKREVVVTKESLNLERIALTAVVALLSWNVYTTNQLTVAQAVVGAQLESLKLQISASAQTMAPRADLLVLDARVASQEARFENWMNRLGDRLNEVEKKVEHVATEG